MRPVMLLHCLVRPPYPVRLLRVGERPSTADHLYYHSGHESNTTLRRLHRACDGKGAKRRSEVMMSGNETHEAAVFAPPLLLYPR